VPPPLEGITVLDFSHALAGPYCTMLLAAWGARVIKIESPGQGDIGRSWGPPFQGGEASFFLGLNGGKQSLCVDLKQPEGLDICRRLATHVDILIENFRPGTMNRLGLDYATVSALNARLIYVSISGYGQTGPRRNEPLMDLVAQAAAGLMSFTGTPEGETVRSGHSVADVTAGMFALIGALLALETRHRTGEGQFVDVSMIDTMMSTMAPNFAYYLGSGNSPIPRGTSYATIVPYRNFACADREISIAVASDKLWENFCRAIGLPDLLTDERYHSNPLRVKHRATLEPRLEATFQSRPAAHWMGVLSEAGIPCSLVRTLREVAEDEQCRARDMLPELEHSTAGRIRVTGVPVKLSRSPAAVAKAAPRLGEDSDAVLSGVLGMGEPELARLRQAGVIA